MKQEKQELSSTWFVITIGLALAALGCYVAGWHGVTSVILIGWGFLCAIAGIVAAFGKDNYD